MSSPPNSSPSTPYNTPPDSPVKPCPLLKAIEVLVLGEDQSPASGIALELRTPSGALHARTAADGTARFDGLIASSYQICPYELDQGAWKLLRAEPLTPEQAQSFATAREAPVPPLTDSAGLVHPTKAGDSVDRLAFQHGLFAATIWDHPRNQTLRSQRESCNVLAEADQVYIPPIRRADVDAQVAMRYVLLRRGVPSRLRLRLLDDLTPLVDTPWTLEIEGEPTRQGSTDGEGTLEAWVPATASLATLAFVAGGQQRVVAVALGTLKPAHAASGWRQRLRNLRFNCDPDDAPELSPNDRGALLRFQDSWGLPLTGTADTATIAKIYAVHDGAPLDQPAAGLYSTKQQQ